MGIQGFDLVTPADWPLVKKYGLVVSMASGGGGSIASALNRTENHAKIEAAMRTMIDQGGVPNLITFSGNAGMSDAEGADNAWRSSTRSRRRRRTRASPSAWSPEQQGEPQGLHVRPLRVGRGRDEARESPRVKILFDIYHAQIMDGDIVRNIRDHFQWIGHFHTGGNPGRHEIDDTQELNYRFVMQAIADLGFTGFVTHEYTPAEGHDPMESLKKAMEICTV